MSYLITPKENYYSTFVEEEEEEERNNEEEFGYQDEYGTLMNQPHLKTKFKFLLDTDPFLRVGNEDENNIENLNTLTPYNHQSISAFHKDLFLDDTESYDQETYTEERNENTYFQDTYLDDINDSSFSQDIYLEDKKHCYFYRDSYLDENSHTSFSQDTLNDDDSVLSEIGVNMDRKINDNYRKFDDLLNTKRNQKWKNEPHSTIPFSNYFTPIKSEKSHKCEVEEEGEEELNRKILQIYTTPNKSESSGSSGNSSGYEDEDTLQIWDKDEEQSKEIDFNDDLFYLNKIMNEENKDENRIIKEKLIKKDDEKMQTMNKFIKKDNKKEEIKDKSVKNDEIRGKFDKEDIYFTSSPQIHSMDIDYEYFNNSDIDTSFYVDNSYQLTSVPIEPKKPMGKFGKLKKKYGL